MQFFQVGIDCQMDIAGKSIFYKMRKIIVISIIFFIGFLMFMCKTSTNNDSNFSGEELAKQYCVSCHLFPEPDLLNKATWHQYVLPRMASFLGVYTDGKTYYETMPSQWIEPGIGGQRVRNANVYPTEKIVTKEEWQKIASYYLENAPLIMSEKRIYKDPEIGIPGFVSSNFLPNKEIAPLIQSIYIHPSKQIIYCAELQGGLFTYDYSGILLDKLDEEAFVVEMQVFEDKFFRLDMGGRMASDNPIGKLQINELSSKGIVNDNRYSLSKMMRPVNFQIGQLDEDQEAEIVVCEYGNLLGSLNIYDKVNNDYKIQTLMEDDGYIRSEIVDFNGDGRMDIVALQGNGDEGIDIFWNNGNNTYEKERILRFLPTNGSTHFSLLDYNKDGQIDVIYTSGDNGDYSPIMKPYHGIYVFLNDKNTFTKSIFLPMNGVYQSEVQDFDQDGDFDIIALAFHPDFEFHPSESFIYFRNDGNNNFDRFTIKEFADSRWMRFATVDIDSDNDLDILITAMNIKTPEISKKTAEQWQLKDTPIILIENKLAH